MSYIYVGRGGGDMHRFTMDEVLSGAVIESGILPELAEGIPKKSAYISTTGAEHKLQEKRSVVVANNLAISFRHLTEVVPNKVFEDSKEEQPTAERIAHGKAQKVILPLRQFEQHLTQKEARKFRSEIARRAGVPHERGIFFETDDRANFRDPRLLEHVYDTLRHHPNPQVREIFEEDRQGIPGTRFREVYSAMGGVLNTLYLEQKANQEFGLNPEGRQDTTIFTQPLFEGVSFPEKGLTVRAEGFPTSYRPVCKKDFLDAAKGRILTLDHFELVDYPGVEPGTTTHQLATENPHHPFFSEVHSPGRALLAATAVMGVPRLPEKFNGFGIGSIDSTKVPRTVVSSAAFLTATPKKKEIKEKLSFPKKMRLSEGRGNITSMPEFERLLHSGQAFVVQDPDQFPIFANHGIYDKDGYSLSEDQIKFLRRLETDLVFSYLATMSTQSGSANHFGRAHQAEKSYFKKRGLWHPDMSNLWLAGDTENVSFSLYEDKYEFKEGLKNWDRTTYQHDVPTPKNDFLNERQIKDIIDVEHMGLIVSGYGSASSFMQQAYEDMYSIFYEASTRGAMTVDGGGTRSAMLGMRMGALNAMDQGYRVLNLGIRSESDVSPLEGDIISWINGLNYTPQQGSDPRHIHFADRQMHILKLDRILQRQTPIGALSHVATLGPGGEGSIFEAMMMIYHNARVKIFGKGIFSGFESNTRVIPLCISDFEFEYCGKERTLFKTFLEKYTQKERDFCELYPFSGKDRTNDLIDFIRMYAEGHQKIYGQRLNFNFGRKTPVHYHDMGVVPS